MRYWLDTEFIEDGKTIDLISIGIVAEDGREYYAVNRECDFHAASKWVLENVLNPMGLDREGWIDMPWEMSPRVQQEFLACKPRKVIARDVALFLGCKDSEKFRYELKDEVDSPEIWAYYADYDWVVFCQLFGTMMELPKGFPMYCRDIKQECDRLGNPELPKQEKGTHNALEDARWNKKAWQFLMNSHVAPIR